MKFSQIVRGTSNEREALIAVSGVPAPVKTLLRPLSAIEETDAVSWAIAYAKRKGARAEDGDPVYEAALMASIVAMACMDPDSAREARTSTFDGGFEQVLRELDTDTLARLHEQQKMYQDECSPSIQAKSAAELLDLARKIANEDDPLAYARISPITRYRCARFTGALLVDLLAWKSASTTPTSSDISESKESARQAESERQNSNESSNEAPMDPGA